MGALLPKGFLEVKGKWCLLGCKHLSALQRAAAEAAFVTKQGGGIQPRGAGYRQALLKCLLCPCFTDIRRHIPHPETPLSHTHSDWGGTEGWGGMEAAASKARGCCQAG